MFPSQAFSFPLSAILNYKPSHCFTLVPSLPFPVSRFPFRVSRFPFSVSHFPFPVPRSWFSVPSFSNITEKNYRSATPTLNWSRQLYLIKCQLVQLKCQTKIKTFVNNSFCAEAYLLVGAMVKRSLASQTESGNVVLTPVFCSRHIHFPFTQMQPNE